MKLFSCVCEQLVFFESVTCIRCNRSLAFLADRGTAPSCVNPSAVLHDLEQSGRMRPDDEEAPC
jgi:hypothetical protein